jgi:hypothetical protein
MIENISHSPVEENHQNLLAEADFGQIISEFDRRHGGILKGNTSSDEDSESFVENECNSLRVCYLGVAIKKAKTQEECLEVLGRTVDCPEHAYVRNLVNDKMAGLSIAARKS